MPTVWKHYPDSGASPPGCGATPLSSILSAGCGRITTRSPPLAPGKRAYTDWTFTASTLRSGRSSPNLDKVDPEGARRARHRYACFENFGEDPQSYGYAAGLGLSHPAAALGRIRPPRRTDCGRPLLLRRIKRAAGAGRRTILPDHVSGPCFFLESARHAYSKNARWPDRTSLARRAAGKGCHMGA